jgi:phospholipid/cholesterol/gamma-HCH transport system substrate-binding protein
MRSGRIHFGIIGLLTGTLLVLVALLIFARYPGFFGGGTTYRAVFHNVSGLNAGDEVRYGGLPIGSVTRMEIDPNDPGRIVVRFRVKRSTPIRADTRASISQVGLLGALYLHLEPGTATAAVLPPGSTLPTTENPSLQDAMRRLAQFLDRADTLLRGVERFAHTSPIERLDASLARIDTLITITTRGANATFAQLDRSFARLDQASDNLSRVIESSDRLIVTVDTALRTAGPQLASTQREALESLRQIRVLLADVREAFTQQGGVDQVVRNISAASNNIARLTERLEADPTSVLKQRSPPYKPSGPKAR